MSDESKLLLQKNALNYLLGYVYIKNELGIYTYSNNRFARLFGFTYANDLEGKCTDDLAAKIPSFNRELHVILKDDTDYFVKQSSQQLTEKIVEAKDEMGGETKFICHRFPVKDSSGANSILGVILSEYEKGDIDKLSFLEGVAACIPGTVFWMDRKGIYLGCNDAAAEMGNFSDKEEVVGKTIFDIVKHSGGTRLEAEVFAEDDEKVMSSGEPLLDDVNSFVSGDGKVIYQLTNKSPLRDSSGKVVGLVGNSVDITKQKETEFALAKAKEEADEANQAKSEFLAMMTHELRTPLNVMLGMAQLIQDKGCTEQERNNFLNSIMTSGESLLGLVNDILDFSKAQSGTLEVRPRPFTFDEFIQQLDTEFTVRAKEMSVVFSVDKPEHLPEYIVADRKRLRQIIYNLCDNAMKFTDEGDVALKIKLLKSKKKEHVRLSFVIQDTGIGIPKEKLESVFDEFSQVSTEKHDEYSRRYGGVGLGLSIVKRLIDLMGASITVESEHGKGTSFTCEFDFGLPNSQEIAKIQADLKEKPKDSQQVLSSHILLVEDNELNQKVAVHMLERLNATVDIAVNGKEALEKLKNPYDIVLMDMSLPDLSGPEVTEMFRKTEEKNDHQLIVALTANIHADDQKKCLDAGMDGFLTKPIMLDQLRELLLKKLG